MNGGDVIVFQRHKRTRSEIARAAGPVHICVFLLFACASSATAQQPSPEDLKQLPIADLVNVKIETVYGASKFIENVGDAPASITIVTGEEIRNYGYRTLADVLKAVRGFYVIYDRNYSYVGVRGFSRPGDYNAAILFLIDGHRDNDNIFNGAYVGTEFPVDIDLIDRIEIVRGPGSAVYGTGAFAAVINVITKRGRDLDGWEISAAGGSWNTYKGRVSYGRRFNNDFEFLLSGSFYDSQGQRNLFFPEFDSPATNNGIAVDADRDQAYSIFADVIRGDFNIHAVLNSRTKHIPTASFGTVFNDPSTKTTDARRYIDFQYAHSLASKWDILGRASVDWYGYNGLYLYDYAGTGIPPFTKNIDLATGTWSNLEFDASRTLFRRHRFAVGAEYRHDFEQHQENYDQQPYQLYLNNDRTSTNAAYYFQDQFSIGRDLILVGGLRSDWYSDFSTTYNPRFALVYTLPEGTRFKFMYNRAFRAPTRYEEFYVSSNSNEGNPTLVPERISSYELEVDKSLGKTLQATAAGFVNRMDGLIAADLNPVSGHVEFGNNDDLHTKGLEFELAGKTRRGLQGKASYSIQNSKNPLSNVVTNSPHQLAKTNLAVPLWREKLFASMEGQYTSRRSTVGGPVLGGFGVLNGTILARHIVGQFEFSANVDNVLNKRYADTGGLEHQEISIPQDGRTFRIALTYRASSR
jgi:outer membrane receptor for ferrienterochelin and colicins